MVWASYGCLAFADYFIVTKELFDIEESLGAKSRDSLHTTRRFEYPWVHQTLAPITGGDIILDAGAGYSLFRFLLAKGAKEIHSIDVDNDCLDWSEKVGVRFGNVFPAFGDITSIPFSSDYFSKVYCISVLEHLPKDKVKKGIEELIRVTRPNGQIAITMDVSLNSTNKQVDLGDFLNLAKDYSLAVPELPPDAMRLGVGEINFAVACIFLGGGGIDGPTSLESSKNEFGVA